VSQRREGRRSESRGPIGRSPADGSRRNEVGESRKGPLVAGLPSWAWGRVFLAGGRRKKKGKRGVEKFSDEKIDLPRRRRRIEQIKLARARGSQKRTTGYATNSTEPGVSVKERKNKQPGEMPADVDRSWSGIAGLIKKAPRLSRDIEHDCPRGSKSKADDP